MKYIHTLPNILIFLSLLFCSACSYDIYKTGLHCVPQDSVRFSVAGSILSGLDGNFTISPIDKFHIFGGYHNKSTDKSNQSIISDASKYQKKGFDVGVAYIMPTYDPNLQSSLAIGYGRCNGNVVHSVDKSGLSRGSVYYKYVSGFYNRFYVQPNLRKSSSRFSLSLSCRIGGIHIDRLYMYEYETPLINQDSSSRRNQWISLIEPGVTCEVNLNNNLSLFIQGVIPMSPLGGRKVRNDFYGTPALMMGIRVLKWN